MIGLQTLAEVVGELGREDTDSGTSTDVMQIVTVETKAVEGDQCSHTITTDRDPGREVAVLVVKYGGSSKGQRGVS